MSNPIYTVPEQWRLELFQNPTSALLSCTEDEDDLWTMICFELSGPCESMVGEMNPFYGLKHTKESKDAMSKALLGRVLSEEWKMNIGKASKERLSKYGHHNKGKSIHTEEHKRYLSESQMGIPLSKETREKISERLKGVPKSEEAKANMSKGGKGKVLSEEHKRKIGEGSLGRKHSDSMKAKMKKIASSRPKVHCCHCDRHIDITAYGRWHGDKCKQKLL